MASDPDPDLPRSLKTTHDMMGAAQERYVMALEHPLEMRDKIPHTNIPGPGKQGWIPWIIEAPLNSIEVLEAILKPSQPFEVHTARHIHRGCRKYHPGRCCPIEVSDGALRRYQRAYNEFIRFQGRLEEDDREISFICLPLEAKTTIRKFVWGTFWHARLHYISIPWCANESGVSTFQNPRALVLHDKSIPGTVHTYENRFAGLLERLGLTGCRFERTLLRPGTTPLPETLRDCLVGIPGKTIALPYYAPEFHDMRRDEIKQEDLKYGDPKQEDLKQEDF